MGSHVFVNFPEPPVRRGEGSDAKDGACHLLTAATFRLIHRVLAPDGGLTVHSDNLVYTKQLSSSIDTVGGFASKKPDASEGAVQEKQIDGNSLSTPIWRGRPGQSGG